MGIVARWILVAFVPVVACVPEIPPPEPLLQPDRATFELEAGPLLAGRCGDTGCHGRADRPLSLFAPGRRRLDGIGTFAKLPLQPAEWDANYAAILGFLDDVRPRRTTLLRKALGRGGHGGGVVFEHTSDPECRALEAWLVGESP